jgi:hypothetical protein
MGQGHYTCLVWGETYPGGLSDNLREWLEERPWKYGEPDIRVNYESTPDWIGVTAVNDGQSARDEAPEDLSYVAIPVDELATRYADGIAKARAVWDAARAERPELGEGRLLLVADYD